MMAPVAYTASSAPEKKPFSDTVYAMSNGSNGRAPESQAAIEDLTRRVREQSDKIQKRLTPYADTLKVFAEARPVTFTWIAIFFALSLIPALCTAGFFLAVTAFFTGTAVVILTSCVIGTLLLSTAFLVPVLVFMGVLATSAVGVLLSLFLAHRLFLHLRAATTEQSISVGSITEGVRSWIEETSSRAGLGDRDYRPPFGEAAYDADEYRTDRKVYRKLDPKPDINSANNLQPEKPKFASEESRTPTLNSTTFAFPNVKKEPQDMFSPPQHDQNALVQMDSHDSEWTSASEHESK